MTRRSEIRLCPGGRSGWLLSGPETRDTGGRGALIRPRSKPRKTVRIQRDRQVPDPRRGTSRGVFAFSHFPRGLGAPQKVVGPSEPVPGSGDVSLAPVPVYGNFPLTENPGSFTGCW